MELFGELRSVLHQARPTQKDWTQLCRLIDEQERQIIEGSVLPYIANLLDRWPDHLRVAPLAWLESALPDHDTPMLSLVRVLPAHPPWSVDVYEDLFYHPNLQTCRRFVARGGRLSPEVLRALAESPLVEKLTHIDVSNNHLRQGVRVLFEYGRFDALASFDASGNPLSADDLWTLAHNETLNALTALTLSRCQINTDALRWLAQCDRLISLAHLDLSGNSLDLAAAQVIANTPVLANLSTLNLMYSGCDIDASCREALANSPFLSSAIRELYL